MLNRLSKQNKPDSSLKLLNSFYNPVATQMEQVLKIRIQTN